MSWPEVNYASPHRQQKLLFNEEIYSECQYYARFAHFVICSEGLDMVDEAGIGGKNE